MNVPGYPKICTLGQRPVELVFDDPVEVTEKVDGSSFAFGVFDGVLYCRSKGVQIDPESLDPGSMFGAAVKSVAERKEMGLFNAFDGVWFYGEYLRKPKHNTLNYDHIPKGHIALFAAVNPMIGVWAHYATLYEYADELELGIVKRVMDEDVYSAQDILDYLATDPVSSLGGPMEGVVIKNFSKEMEYVGKYSSFTVAKFVTEKFKEVHQSTWKAENTDGGKWAAFKEQYRTPQRWHKAVQHLRDAGILHGSPKDIGQLIVEVQKDIGMESKEEIKNALWRVFGKDLLRFSTKGLPEWYKEQLALGEINAGGAMDAGVRGRIHLGGADQSDSADLNHE
jgi:hypothetical protein